MSYTTGRTVRLSALALATGTLVATAASGAGAATARATASNPTSYAGGTNTTALDLSLLQNVPGTSAIPVDQSDGLLSLQLLPGTSTLVHDATGKTADRADSALSVLGGTLQALAAMSGSSALVPSTSSSLANPGPNTTGSPIDPLAVGPLANVKIPDLTAQSSKSGAPLSTSSSGTGANLSTLSLSSLVPAAVLAQFQSGFSSLTAQITALQSVITQLQTATAALPALPALPVPVPGLPTGTSASTVLGAVSTSLTAIQQEAQTVFNQLTGGSLLAVNGLVSTSSVSQVAGQEVSVAHVELGNLNLFGGLATLTGFNNTVTAKAGGTPGSASFTPDVANGGLGKATLLGASGGIDSSGLTSDFGALAAIVGALTGGAASASTLNTAVTTLEGGIATLNTGLMGLVTLTADTPSDVTVAKDGTSASGRIDGLGLSVNLPTLAGLGSISSTLTTLATQLGALPGLSTVGSTLTGVIGQLPLGSLERSHAAVAPRATTPAATQILALRVGSAAASVEASNAAPAAPAAPPTTAVKAGATQLAFTGADLPLTGAVAVALIAGGAGLVLRRRRTSSEL